MKPKEIHDLLLSLLVRGLGIWLLYCYSPDFIGLVDRFLEMFNPRGDDHPTVYMFTYGVIEYIAKLALAAYFVLGAPPFLKWATRARP